MKEVPLKHTFKIQGDVLYGYLQFKSVVYTESCCSDVLGIAGPEQSPHSRYGLDTRDARVFGNKGELVRLMFDHAQEGTTPLGDYLPPTLLGKSTYIFSKFF